MCPAEPFVDVFFFVWWKCGIPYDPNTQRNTYKTPNIWRKKALQGHINLVCKIQGLSLKRRGYWTLKEFGVISVNQPVYFDATTAGDAMLCASCLLLRKSTRCFPVYRSVESVNLICFKVTGYQIRDDTASAHFSRLGPFLYKLQRYT